MSSAVQNAKGSASAPTLPSHGPSIPAKENEMNEDTNTTAPTSGATEGGELAVDRVNRLAAELSLAMDQWHEDTSTRFVAHVFAASTGRGVWFQNEIHGTRTMSSTLGDVIDTLNEAEDFCEAVYMAASGVGDRDMTNALQRVIQTAKNLIFQAACVLEEMQEPAR